MKQPGHEYTKQNVKFLKKVADAETTDPSAALVGAVKDIDAFAENNKETQGKKTIGDEKVKRVLPR